MQQQTHNKAPLKILLADTEYSQYLALKQLLSVKNGFRAKVLWCGERDQYLNAMLTGIYDMVLMDYSVESLFILEHAIVEGCRTPVVMLADQSSETLMMRAAKCGALGVLSRKQPEQHSLKYFLLSAEMHRHQGGDRQMKEEYVSDDTTVLARNKLPLSPTSLVRH